LFVRLSPRFRSSSPMVRLRWFQPRVRRSSNRAVQGKFQSVLICRTERKKAAEIVSGPSGKNTCLMKSPPLPRMLLQAWRRDEPKWSRKLSSAERNNCDVTAAPQALCPDFKCVLGQHPFKAQCPKLNRAPSQFARQGLKLKRRCTVEPRPMERPNFEMDEVSDWRQI